LAACQATPGSEWILAKVIQYETSAGMYKLSDEDVESNKSTYFFAVWCNRELITAGAITNSSGVSFSLVVFHLPESQVIVLGEVDKLARGDVVYAVYPDTTSFYQATVVQLPRKASGFVMLNFVDDSDEFGVTHDKAVPMKYVMMPPYGASL
jgi:hypothetical protein